MPPLQIQDLPDPLQPLEHHRALADLEAVAGGDPRQRRRALLDRIAQRGALHPSLDWAQTAEDWIRADRDC